jgi:3-oxoadipate enol-lactonase
MKSGTPWETVYVGPAPRIALSVAGSGPLVLFLHGIGGNRRHWDRQLAAFAPRFRAVAWDARGYGDSDDYQGPLRFPEFSTDVLRVLDFFGEEKSHLVGLSMGGRIARNFALEHPGRVATLVLANTSPGFDALTPEEVRRFVEERKARSPEASRRLISPRARPGALEELIAGFDAVHPVSYEKTVEASVTQDRAAPLEQIRVPTLVLTSEDDPLYSPELARGMARRIPGAELVEIPGAGHLSNLEQPERFNAAVLQFLLRYHGAPADKENR